MASCCDPRGCDRFFGERVARRVAKRYRKRGLDKTAQRIVAYLEARGIEGATVLEVGGGVGEIQIELLRRGARRGVNLELSAAYEGEAQRLLAEAGLAGRVERRLVDIAVAPGEVEPADAVVPHRVVCCYPDYERLLGAAADRAGRLLVFSYPRRNAISRPILRPPCSRSCGHTGSTRRTPTSSSCGRSPDSRGDPRGRAPEGARGCAGALRSAFR